MTTKVKINTKELKFKVPFIVEPDGSSFFAHSPGLKGLIMDGDTEEEALNNAKLTAQDMLRIMVQEGIPIPVGILIYDKDKDAAAVADKKGYYEEEITVNL